VVVGIENLHVDSSLSILEIQYSYLNARHGARRAARRNYSSPENCQEVQRRRRPDIHGVIAHAVTKPRAEAIVMHDTV